MNSEAWAELRAALAPDGPGFDSVCLLLNSWPREELPLALEYAREHLDSWPDGQRHTALKSWEAPAFSLARAWNISIEHFPERATPQDLGHLLALSLDVLDLSHEAELLLGWGEGELDLQSLRSLVGLRYLEFRLGIGIDWGTELVGKVSMPKLRHLNATNINVSDLSILEGFPRLELLHLDGMRLHSIRGIEGASRLGFLSLHISDFIEDFGPLRELPLHTLHLGFYRDKAADLSLLSEHPSLRALHLTGTTAKLELGSLTSHPDIQLSYEAPEQPGPLEPPED